MLERTGADGVMIGRAAQGRPWIFREIAHYLATGEHLPPPPAREIGAVLLEHLEGLYALYGEEHGARVARKHIGWYVRALARRRGAAGASVNARCSAAAARSVAAVNDYFDETRRMSRKATSLPTPSSARSSATSRTWTARSRPRSTTWC